MTVRNNFAKMYVGLVVFVAMCSNAYAEMSDCHHECVNARKSKIYQSNNDGCKDLTPEKCDHIVCASDFDYMKAPVNNPCHALGY